MGPFELRTLKGLVLSGCTDIMGYEALDFYDVDSLLTDEERMIRDAVRDWVDESVIPKIENACRDGVFLDEWRQEIGSMGILGAPLKGYGCPGLSYTAYGVICRELERGDSGIRSFASVQGSLAMYPIWDFGSEDQKERYLPRMATGELIGCFGLTEPDYGSNPGDMVTKATEDGDSFILNGAKMWITNGTIADLAPVWAKLDGVIRGFIVEKGDPGFSAPEMKGKHSLKASVTSELVFQDCRIPKDQVTARGKGLEGAILMSLTMRDLGSLGVLSGRLRHATILPKSYALSRIQFDHPIAAYQLVQNKLAWMLREITKGQLLAYHLGKKKDAGEWIPEHISLAKMNNVDIALEIARVSRDIHGANGISRRVPGDAAHG